MHGLINRSIQFFIQSTYGDAVWSGVARRAGMDVAGFETMLPYDDALTDAVLDAAAGRLSKPRSVLMEDWGTFLVSDPQLEPLRRLLRFGGDNFVEFLHSLNDLNGRARLAVPDLEMPELDLVEGAGNTFHLDCRWQLAGGRHIVAGVLRALADDYGALVLLEEEGDGLSIALLDSAFAKGRSFALAQGAM